MALTDEATSSRLSVSWQGTTNVSSKDFKCGYCGKEVGPGVGYAATASGQPTARILICPRCNQPTYFKTQFSSGVPGVAPGEPVTNCPPDLTDLYVEARNSAAAGAYTGSVMICRKLIMNIAVNEGAKEGLSFVKYVDYLSDNGFVSPKMKDFVDYIRTLGNEANHEIHSRTKEDAEAAIEFVGAILRHNYELPAKLPKTLNPNQPSE